MLNLQSSAVSKNLAVFTSRIQNSSSFKCFSHSSLPNSADLAYAKIVVKLLRQRDRNGLSQTALLNRLAASLGFKHFSSLSQAVPGVLQSVGDREGMLPDVFLWVLGQLAPGIMDQKRGGEGNNPGPNLVEMFRESLNVPVFHFSFNKAPWFAINEILIFPTGVLLDKWEDQERMHDVFDLSLLAIDYNVEQDCELFRKQDVSIFLWWAKAKSSGSSLTRAPASASKGPNEDPGSDEWRRMAVNMFPALVNVLRADTGGEHSGLGADALLEQLESLLDGVEPERKFQAISDLFSKPPSYCVLKSACLSGICNSPAIALAFPDYSKSATLCTGVFSSKGGRVPEYFSSDGEGDYHKGNAVWHASADVPKDELLLWKLGLNATQTFGRLKRSNSVQLLTAEPTRMYGAVDKEGNFRFSSVREKRHHVIISPSDRKYGGLSPGKLLMEPSSATLDLWEKHEGMAKEHHGWIIQNPDGTFWMDTLSPTEEEARSWWGTPEKALKSQALGMRLVRVRVFMDKGE